MRNKRGQELSTNAIILIILGVLVLVALVIGFVFGWGKLSNLFQKDNVNDVVDSCNTACSTKSVYDFCLRKREVIAEKETYKNFTCYYMQGEMKTDLSKDFGVKTCADLACTNVLFIKDNPVGSVVLPLDSGADGKSDECTNRAGKYIQFYEAAVSKQQLHDFSCP